MISEARPAEAYVWVWLPGATQPVVAGRLAPQDGRLVFNYGRSYLARPAALPLFLPELPLRRGALVPLPGLLMAGCLRDASPDAWGRRIVLNRMFGRSSADRDPGDVDELTYLLRSASDRAGALDVQDSSSTYVARETGTADLTELLDAAALVEAGQPLSPALDAALMHGSSIGGARPKALIADAGHSYIAKFSSRSDIHDVVRSEFVAMRLARRLGLRAASVELRRSAGKDVLLVERFDRILTTSGWERKAMVSGLTVLGLDETMARYASYQDLAEHLRRRSMAPTQDLAELFGRMVFNVLVGNTDDHARNHAVFWDGSALTLTPAFDVCPQARAGQEASQAMLVAGGDRASRLTTCLAAAPDFLMGQAAAEGVIAAQVRGIVENWQVVCDEAALAPIERDRLWRRQILNPFAFYDAPAGIAALAPG